MDVLSILCVQSAMNCCVSLCVVPVATVPTYSVILVLLVVVHCVMLILLEGYLQWHLDLCPRGVVQCGH